MPSGNNSGGSKGDGTPPKPQLENLCSIAQSVTARKSAESRRIQEMGTSESDGREEAGATSAPHVPGTSSRDDSFRRLRSPTSVPTSTLGPERRVLSAFRRDEDNRPETAAQVLQKQKERRVIERRVWEKRIADFEADMGSVSQEMESMPASKKAAASDPEELARLDERYTELEKKFNYITVGIEVHNRRLADNPEL